jgi:hypothetical protein
MSNMVNFISDADPVIRDVVNSLDIHILPSMNPGEVKVKILKFSFV